MYYARMAIGFVMCAVGGWQLADVLNDGPGGGDSEASSSSSYQWAAGCDDVARRAFGPAPHSDVDIQRGMLNLRERGCDANHAPTGVIPMVSDDGPGGASQDDASPDDWGNGSEDWQLRQDGWAD